MGEDSHGNGVLFVENKKIIGLQQLLWESDDKRRIW